MKVELFSFQKLALEMEEQIANDLETIIKRDKIVVGIKTDTYPFGYIDDKGHFAGYDASLARLIARGILGSDKKVKFVPVTSSDRVMKLYTGDVDMLIATMSITSKRQEIIDFSNPYHMAGQAVLVKKGSPVKSIRDLSGKTAIIVFIIGIIVAMTSFQSLNFAVKLVLVLGVTFLIFKDLGIEPVARISSSYGISLSFIITIFLSFIICVHLCWV